MRLHRFKRRFPRPENFLLDFYVPDMKQVVNTNKAVVYVEKYDDQLLMISCIDNLLKGAVGQAVQNMNLMFGIDETSGLHLKASAF